MTTQKLLRVSECAKRLNCSRKHVYYLIESAELAALSIGRNGKGLRVRECDLNKFIEDRSQQHQRENGFSDSTDEPNQFL